jgi:Calcineurin-like phosphoesterase
MLNKRVLVSSISVLLLLALSPALLAQSVTFVQFTDPHLYDAGAYLLPEGAKEEFLDNRAALDWAILQTNRLQASGKHLDFVAITGDFGLDAPSPGLTPSSIDQLATSLGALQVNMILVVPGNNDLVDEPPSDISRFRKFVQDLQARLPNYIIIDLCQRTVVVNRIRLLGLDSSSFENANGKDKEANRAEQLKEMQRVAGEVKKGEPHIIFTHIPDLEDPYRGSSGKDVHEAWQIDKSGSDIWKKIISSKEVIGVFAGHFHDPRRVVYAQDYSWADKKPDLATAVKTWVAPPLAAEFQEKAEPRARGCLLVTVTATGKVTATPYWYAIPTQVSSPIDKASNLLEGDEATKDGEWQKAADAYKDALASSDAVTRAAATRGYQHARDEMRGLWWKQKLLHGLDTYFRENWVEFAILILAALLVTLLYYKWTWLRHHTHLLLGELFRPRSSPIIMAPVKYTSDAPSELFAAEMAATGEHLRSILSTVLAAPIVHSRRGSTYTLYLPSPSFQQAIESLPEMKGVDLGKIAKFVFAVFRFLSWRVESGIGTANNQAVGIALLRNAWTVAMIWRASGPMSSPLDVGPVARELAYNILGVPFVG